MAAKRKSSKKTTTKKQTRTTTRSAEGNRQLYSVVWFAVAIFLLCVVFIKGQNIWTYIHNFIFGIFGVTAYFYPFLLGFIAVMFATNKIGSSIKAKIIEGTSVVVLIGAIIDIFATKVPDLTFWKHLAGACCRRNCHLRLVTCI